MSKKRLSISLNEFEEASENPSNLIAEVKFIQNTIDNHVSCF